MCRFMKIICHFMVSEKMFCFNKHCKEAPEYATLALSFGLTMLLRRHEPKWYCYYDLILIGIQSVLNFKQNSEPLKFR